MQMVTTSQLLPDGTTETPVLPDPPPPPGYEPIEVEILPEPDPAPDEAPDEPPEG
jgi:hypothetical protein